MHHSITLSRLQPRSTPSIIRHASLPNLKQQTPVTQSLRSNRQRIKNGQVTDRGNSTKSFHSDQGRSVPSKHSLGTPNRHISSQSYIPGLGSYSRTSDDTIAAMASRLLQASDVTSLRAFAATRGFYSQPEHRESDDIVSFYDDKLTQYANQDIQMVTLKTLLGLGRSGSSTSSISKKKKTATTSISQQEDQDIRIKDLAINLDVARYARKELPVRLARLIKSTQKLPFIVGTNPYIKKVYKLYYDSFQTITASPEEINDKEGVDKFADLLKGLVASHADVIPMLSQGFLECQKYMQKDEIRKYLDSVIRSRIGIRLIAEQVISLREQRFDRETEGEDGKDSQKTSELKPQDVVGVVHTELRPAELVKTCANFVQELCDINYGSSPEVVINGQTDTTFTYVPVHLEYILCELLKNALRATVEFSKKNGRSTLDTNQNNKKLYFASSADKRSNSTVILNEGDDQDVTKRPNEFGHPPVEVTIAQGHHEVTIRIRDHGGGIPREHLESVFEYSFTTVKNENEDSGDAGSGNSPYGVDSIFKGVSRLAMQAGLGGPIAGLGFGLPLARIYAQYFGGSMELVSLQGYGCDVFLKLKQIDETLDDLQI
ncbi:hypothetical protein BGZ76_001603 [Entomortierella beljakovae]|nr:hypothetical protein BGZ76_001603 [Entomortierella beljakovae]